MFLTGPAVVAEVTGEELDAVALGGPRVHERNGVCHLTAASEVEAALLARELLDYPPAALRRAARRSRPRWRPPTTPRIARCRRARARSTTCGVVARALVDAGRLLEITPRCAAQRRVRPRPPGGQGGRDRRQPAAPPRRRARRWQPRRRPRASCAPATRSGCRSSCSSTRPGSCPGSRQEQGGGDPPRREARARLRGEQRAERDRRAAQGLRRRVHRDELEGARSRRRARVAGSGARRDGRRAGRRRSSTGARSRRRTTPPSRGAGSPAPTPASTSASIARAPRDSSTR